MQMHHRPLRNIGEFHLSPIVEMTGRMVMKTTDRQVREIDKAKGGDKRV